MTASAAVVVCALELLGRSTKDMPPIELVDVPPPEASPQANGFVRRGTPVIFLITSSGAFREARCENRQSLIHLASVIVHEAWHVQHGSDERGAYEAQLHALLLLGARPQHWTYKAVYRSMQSVLKAQKEEARRVAALRASGWRAQAQTPAPAATLASGTGDGNSPP